MNQSWQRGTVPLDLSGAAPDEDENDTTTINEPDRAEEDAFGEYDHDETDAPG